MELLLNLAWLLLALPAYWLWRGRRSSRTFSSLQCLLALGCLLVILFPVVSATDDLRAMRAEMEESPTSKRSLRQAATDKAPLWSAKWRSVAAVASSAAMPFIGDAAWQQLSSLRSFMPAAPAIERAGRAPPISFLA
jgi:hypothetical protein